MTTENQDAEHPNDAASGGADDSGKGATVTREAYERLLREKKAEATKRKEAADRLATLEAEKKARDEDEAKKRNEHESIIAKRDAELAAAKAEAEALKAEKVQAHKLGAFLRAAGGQIDRKFHPLIDLDAIEVDANGVPDPDSVKKAVDAYKSEYAETIQTGKGSGGAVPPGAKPNGNGAGDGPSSYAEWLALPPAERKKTMAKGLELAAKK